MIYNGYNRKLLIYNGYKLLQIQSCNSSILAYTCICKMMKREVDMELVYVILFALVNVVPVVVSEVVPVPVYDEVA